MNENISIVKYKRKEEWYDEREKQALNKNNKPCSRKACCPTLSRVSLRYHTHYASILADF